MRDLIDRQAAIETVDFECGEWRGLAWTIINGLKNLPAVDAVPVVRCRDCNEYQQSFHWCKLHDGEMQPNDFCSYGERREK